MADEQHPSGASPDSYWIIPLKALAIVMGLFGFTCLAVLVVVTAINDESALSTVALALAILAFTVQLIVFVAQQGLATEQGRRNEELYGSMQGLLAEIREKAAGTQVEVRRIGDRTEQMLPAILSKNLADAAGGEVNYERLASDIERTFSSTDGDGEFGDPEDAPDWPARRFRPDDSAVIHQLETYPEKGEAEEVLQKLSDLSTDARARLKSFGEDEIRARQPKSPLDPALIEDEGGELEERGLIEPHPDNQPSPPGTPFAHLTDLGRQVARLLTANGNSPDYLPGLEEMREETPDRFPDWPPREALQ